MNTSAAVAAGPSLVDFHVGQASIAFAELSGHLGVDEGAIVSYHETQGFELTWWFAPDPQGPPTRTRQLNDEDLQALQNDINATLANPPANLDVTALKAFGELVENTLGAGPDLFAEVRFGQTVEEIFGGTRTIIGHIGLGVDVAGTIHDHTGGMITWEHHIVPLPPGPFRALTAHERTSLKDALTTWLETNSDSGWQQILADLG
jgi:hypothetical protein